MENGNETKRETTEDNSGPSTSSTNNIQQEFRSMKQILDEVLNCTVVKLPHQEQNEENSHSNKLVTVKEILGDILEYNVYNKARTVDDNQHISEPSTSTAHHQPLVLTVPELDIPKSFQLYRTYEPMLCACNILDDEDSVVPPTRILPSYSSVMRQGPQSGVLSTESFVQRIPPPSYAQVKGLDDDTPSGISADSIVFGPDPLYLICPVCRIIVITEIERERTNVSHWIALILCLCMCWPCCFLPYYMKSCSYTYHSCPTCGHYFGMYNPF